MQRITCGLYVGKIRHLKHHSKWPGTAYAKTKRVLVWHPDPMNWVARQIWKTHTDTLKRKRNTLSKA